MAAITLEVYIDGSTNGELNQIDAQVEALLKPKYGTRLSVTEIDREVDEDEDDDVE